MVTFERRITFHVNRMTHDAQIHCKFVVGLFMYWARFPLPYYGPMILG